MEKILFQRFFSVGILCLTLMAILSSLLFYNIWKDDFHRSLMQEANIISAIDSTEKLDATVLAQISNHSAPDLRITWIDKLGRVLYDSNGNANTMENHLARPEVKMALANGTGSDFRVSNTLHEVNYYVAEKISDGSIIRLSRVGSSLYQVIFTLTLGIMVLFILTGIFCYFLAKNMTNSFLMPILQLVKDWEYTNDFEHIKAGNHNITAKNNYSHTPRINSEELYSELAPLVYRLDDQHKKLQAAMSDILSERNTLRFIMDAMKEGILLADAEGNVEIYNKISKTFFHIPDGVDQTLSIMDLSVHNQWIESCRTVLKTKENVSYVSQQKDEFYRITLYPTVENIGGPHIIVIITNITSAYLAEKRRKEFTANVSHELKTPLTTISGYAEIIEQHMYQNEKDVQVLGGYIRNAAKQMISMIESILHLAQVEKGFGDLPVTEVSISSIVEQAWEMVRNKYKIHNDLITIGSINGSVCGNETLLTEVFINLLDNAVKFNDRTTLHITVSAEIMENYMRINIGDNGIGISSENQARIFERFFEADTSRGKYEGSGIGLALVKHIMDIHNGTVSVTSVEGESTVFTLTFPLYKAELN